MKQFAGTPGENDMSKYTDWYPAEVKPVREGLYQRKYRMESQRRYPDRWDGEKWILIAPVTGVECGAAREPLEWRGLKEPAK